MPWRDFRKSKSAIKGQIDDLLAEIRDRAAINQRVLVTALTKRMAEDLANYYSEVGVRCRYMHSEIETSVTFFMPAMGMAAMKTTSALNPKGAQRVADRRESAQG